MEGRLLTDAEMVARIYQGKQEIEDSGNAFGKIELIVHNGEIKHVNVSYEILPEGAISVSRKTVIK